MPYIGTMRNVSDKFIRWALGRPRTWNAACSEYRIASPSTSQMLSSTASAGAGIVAVHRHQGFGSPSAYPISHFPLGKRHGSDCTLLAPLKIASNERPSSILPRSSSVSRSSPPPSASSARSCARQSTSIATPAKKHCQFTTRYLSEGDQSGIKHRRIRDPSAHRSRDAFHGRVGGACKPSACDALVLSLM